MTDKRQASLFDAAPPARPRRVRPTLGHQHHTAVDPVLDRERLTTQFGKVIHAMSDKQWHNQHELAKKLNIPQGSVGSQIRNARVDGYIIEKCRVGAGGTWAYRLVGRRV